MQEHRSRPAAIPTEEELFGEVMRELRKEKGLSQEKLAFASDYHPTYISMLERGKKSPSLKAIMSLARALNTNGSVMLRRVESRLRQSA